MMSLVSNPMPTTILYRIVMGMILGLPWLLVAVMVVGAGVYWIRDNRNRRAIQQLIGGEKMKDEKGIVLVLSLLMLTVLGILAMGFLTIALIENNIAANYQDHTAAFYAADGGTEIGRQLLKVTGNWTTLEGQAVDCSFTQGQCEYTISNTKDDFAIVTTIATHRRGRSEVQAAFGKVEMPVPPGGITSIGSPGFVALNGNAFTVDGNNWVPPQGGNPEYLSNGAAACSTPVPKFGVAVQDASSQALILAGLSAQQADNIDGLGGIPSVGIDATLTHQMILDLVAAFEGVASATYPAGTQLTSQTVGTQADPTVIVADGNLSLNASNGAGILIVKNGTLELKGNTEWVGLILLVGDNAKLSMSGGGDKSIYGSVIIAETTGVASEIFAGNGNLKIRFSCDGLNVADYAASGINAKQLWWQEARR